MFTYGTRAIFPCCALNRLNSFYSNAISEEESCKQCILNSHCRSHCMHFTISTRITIVCRSHTYSVLLCPYMWRYPEELVNVVSMFEEIYNMVCFISLIGLLTWATCLMRVFVHWYACRNVLNHRCMLYTLIHLCLVPHKRDRGVWSWPTLFSLSTGISIIINTK